MYAVLKESIDVCLSAIIKMSEKEESRSYFWLKTISKSDPKEKVESENQYTNLFVRLVGSGSDAVVVTQQPPKFLRSHLSKDGQLCFTSSAPQHAGRQWALVLDEKNKEDIRSSTQNRPAWAPVLIKEGQGDLGFTLSNSELSSQLPDFHGFVVCQWVYGHPQLFWLTEAFKGDLPDFIKRINLIESPYSPG